MLTSTLVAYKNTHVVASVILSLSLSLSKAFFRIPSIDSEADLEIQSALHTLSKVHPEMIPRKPGIRFQPCAV
jgi:hypothetical protein